MVIGYKYKNNFGVELFLFTKQCHVQNVEVACNGAYSVNFLDDSELLDLGFALKHYLSLDTCALIKNNMLNIFMLSGSIQFSIAF